MGKRGRRAHPDILTPREWEVLGLLRERLTNEQIAERLGISLDGAKYHVSEILSKLGASTREEAAAWRPIQVRPWWKRLIAAPAAILGAATVVVATAGLAVLGWGVVVTSGPAQEVAEPTATPVEDSIEGTAEEVSAIKIVLESLRRQPCTHPDASSAKATLSTMDEVRYLLKERLTGEVVGPTETPWVAGLEQFTPSSAPVWLVEVKSDISARIKPGNACVPEPTSNLVLTLVADGVITGGQWSRLAD